MSSLLRGHCRSEVGSAAKYYFSKTSTRKEVKQENGNVEVNNLSQSTNEHTEKVT